MSGGDHPMKSPSSSPVSPFAISLAPRLAAVVAGAALSLLAGRAGAAEVAPAECLAASDASIRSDNQHRFRAERAELLVCASPSCPADIRRECIRRVEE